MLAAVRPDREEAWPEAKAIGVPVVPPPIQRHGYAPPAGTRLYGLIGTCALFALAIAGFFVTLTVTFIQPPVRPALTVVNLRPLASPPEKPPERKEAPRPVEKKETPPEPPKAQPIDRSIVPIAPIPMPAAMPRLADPAPKQPETAAPKTLPAPPAPQLASNASDSWEGRVLAALDKRRRYPIGAMARRQQGVPYVRFVMDRNGKVLSSRLERSSGFPELDREAVALPRRAQPLPKPPDDKPGDALELVVPVEFFMSGGR
ncbi:MAG: TonB family protein [Sphingomonas bacterium]